MNTRQDKTLREMAGRTLRASLHRLTRTPWAIAFLALTLGSHPAPAEVEPAMEPLCVKGRSISVLYAGAWYPAKVLDGPDAMGTCLISYDGYGSNWDEWVNASRMRPVDQMDVKQPAEGASLSTRLVPEGTYSCYTFDNGLLNYSYTDVIIEADGRYRVDGEGGTYTVSGQGTVHFTGVMANAVGTFLLKGEGRPQLDLVFDGDARASMSCPRTH